MGRFRSGRGPVFLAALAAVLCSVAGCSNEASEVSKAGVSATVALEQAPADSPLRYRDQKAESEVSPSSSTSAVLSQYAPKTKTAIPRKIIYTAEIELVAGDLEKTRRELVRRVKAHGGYLSDTALSGSTGESREGTWTVRIPVDRYEAFVEEVSRLGEVQALRTGSQDVSEEFYDIESRLKAKRVAEERLLKHLERSTTRLTDILAVERELSRVHSEIEQMEGRLRFLANQTDLTTVTITIHEAKGYTPPSPETLGTQVARTFSESVRLLGDTGKGILLTLIALLPWLLVIGLPLMFLLRRAWRRRPQASPALSD